MKLIGGHGESARGGVKLRVHTSGGQRVESTGFLGLGQTCVQGHAVGRGQQQPCRQPKCHDQQHANRGQGAAQGRLGHEPIHAREREARTLHKRRGASLSRESGLLSVHSLYFRGSRLRLRPACS